MKLLTLSPLFALASWANAAPAGMLDEETRANITAARLEARDGDPPGGPIVCYGGPPCVKTSGTGDTCILNFQVTGSFAHQWAVGIPGDTLSNYGTGSSTLGGGLLDNLRGQCGVITDWTATSDDNNNLAARFSTTTFCGSDDVHNAIWLANGMHYDANCVYEDDSWSSIDGFSTGVTQGLQALFDAIGILVPRT